MPLLSIKKPMVSIATSAEQKLESHLPTDNPDTAKSMMMSTAPTYEIEILSAYYRAESTTTDIESDLSPRPAQKTLNRFRALAAAYA
ncbi:MAG: hypothetical protein JKX92_02590 [Porticoccaceae bacterium]|nr:hypothetical protein [Porticoccaceae bacterium]